MTAAFLHDLSLQMASHASVMEACDTFNAWCVKHFPESMDAVLLRSDLLHGTRFDNFNFSQHAFPHRIQYFVERCGKEGLDAWWEQQGKKRFWCTSSQQPRPELAHLLVFAIMRGPYMLIQWTLDQGWPPDVVDASVKRRTPLHYIAEHAFPDNKDDLALHESHFDRLLTAHTVQAQDSEGMTPLGLLLSTQQPRFDQHDILLPFCQKLLRSGADINRPDKEGNTPLHHYMKGGSVDVRSVGPFLRFLLESGADPWARRARAPFETPLELLEHTFDTLRGEPATSCMRTLLRQAMCMAEANVLHESLLEAEAAQSPHSEAGEKELRKRLRGRV